MARKFLTNIDLSKNELQNVVIHKLALPPSNPVNGLIYLNTSEHKLYQYIDGAWKDISGSLDSILTTTTALVVTDNNDGTFTLNISGANGSNSGLMSSAHYIAVQNATDSATENTIVKRDASGNISVDQLIAETVTISQPAVNPTDAVTKSYVDTLVTSGMKVKGVIDASGTPNYPSAVIGDAYHITVGGKVGGASGQDVEVGDMVICVTATSGGTEAVAGDDFIILQNNIDLATETTPGLIRFATATESSNGTNVQAAVTPSQMATYVGSLVTSGKYSATIGDGSSTMINITHSLGTEDVMVQLRDFITNEVVEADITIGGLNSITIGFSVAPSLNSFRAVIQG